MKDKKFTMPYIIFLIWIGIHLKFALFMIYQGVDRLIYHRMDKNFLFYIFQIGIIVLGIGVLISMIGFLKEKEFGYKYIKMEFG